MSNWSRSRLWNAARRVRDRLRRLHLLPPAIHPEINPAINPTGGDISTLPPAADPDAALAAAVATIGEAIEDAVAFMQPPSVSDRGIAPVSSDNTDRIMRELERAASQWSPTQIEEFAAAGVRVVTVTAAEIAGQLSPQARAATTRPGRQPRAIDIAALPPSNVPATEQPLVAAPRYQLPPTLAALEEALSDMLEDWLAEDPYGAVGLSRFLNCPAYAINSTGWNATDYHTLLIGWRRKFGADSITNFHNAYPARIVAATIGLGRLKRCLLSLLMSELSDSRCYVLVNDRLTDSELLRGDSPPNVTLFSICRYPAGAHQDALDYFREHYPAIADSPLFMPVE